MQSPGTDVATIPESSGLVQMLERLALSPDVDVQKLERLLQMQERIFDRNAEAEFAAAMTRVQAQLPTVLRKSKNEQTSSLYAKHEHIAKIIKPIYTAEGFSITFSEDDSPKEKHVRVVAILRHNSGYKERHHIDVAIDDVGLKGNTNKTLTHAEGSSQSYGRRRLTCMMFDIATGDDNDGNGAGVAKITEQQLADLEALIEEAGANRAAYIKHLKLERLEDLPAKSYDTAVKWLDAKRKQAK